MRFHFALAFSMLLHAFVIIAPSWFERAPSAPTLRLEAVISPPPAESVASQVSTEANAEPPPMPPPASPQKLQGRALNRAQAALSKHLYYPPAAVAQGQEGEVLLLLVLDERGSVVSSEIFRSSGYELLDRAALDAARLVGLLPGSPRQTLLPVAFRLE